MDVLGHACSACLSALKRSNPKSNTSGIPTGFHFGVILWILLITPQGTRTDVTIRRNTVISWADELGRRLYNLSRTYSGSDVVHEQYGSEQNIEILPVNGEDLVQSMANQMQTMLQDKAKAVERIVQSAEEGFLNHDYDNATEFTYYNAILVNTNTTVDPDLEKDIRKELDVTPDSHFDNIPINTTIATIQVPTNVYNQGIELLNSIEATVLLDETYHENYQNDPTLTWQYFGSRTGYFRVYPGYRWVPPIEDLDLYDCRVRGWYVEGATSPKDVVILVDMSGSMTGLYVEIAKYAIKKILDTFGDNDFVNVISFNETTKFIQPCFNDTLVQATSDNKNLIKDALTRSVPKLEPYGMADLSKAVRHAFNLLSDFNSTNRGSGCNQAIMIISDMLTETAEDVFRELNPNQTVRVFTYQTGREVDGPTNLIKVACENRGYYTRLATISDVEEHVTSYLHVLSRPMVNKRLRKTVWSSVYWDALGLGLTCSVSQPVFNVKNETMDKGILEGVAGCDVPINELKKFTPPFKLGVNGYSFAITNNGYILYHPELRYLHTDGKVKPNYNSVDLAEVELSDTEDVLRNEMVDRLSGSVTMEIKHMFDDMKRVSVRRSKYYFTPLHDTPYSLGISLPESYANKHLETPALFEQEPSDNQSSADVCEIQQAARLLFGDGTLGQTIIANWLYCKINYSSSERYEGEEHVARFLQDAAKKGGKLSSTCDTVMVNHLIFDANVTRFMPDYWKLVYGEALPSTVDTTMFTTLPTNETEQEIFSNIQNILAQIDEYCSPGGRGYTTATPHNQTQDSAEETDILTTGDTGTHPTEPPNMRYTTSLFGTTENVPYLDFPYLDPKRDGVVLSFLGTYGGLTRIYHNPNMDYMFPDFSSKDRQNTIEEDYFRRPVDEINEGFIYSVPFDTDSDYMFYSDPLVTASTAIHVNKDGSTFVTAAAGYQFLGSALKELFFNITSYQYEEDCGYDCTPSCYNDSVECFLIDNNGYIVVSKDEGQVGTHFAMYSQNLRLFDKLVSDNIFQEITVVDYQGMCERNFTVSAAPTLRNTLSNIMSMFTWLANQFIVFLSHASMYDWLISTFLPGDTLAERVWFDPCEHEYTFYVANKTGNIVGGQLYGSFQTSCTDCTKSFGVQPVPYSNLLLVIQDRDCSCNARNSIQLDPEEVIYNETAWCQRLRQFKTRRRPDTCFKYDPNEDSSECGRGIASRPSTCLILIGLVLTAWWRHHY
ncbi:voltage-dependent calcium channel subunit alpha-2/delta-3-like isoform X2 [Lytechinus variegatus]|uniref:voltage-dependent calcium channel subunit alpha-2/delta-3-like isoform X2 n=1 Tax=Lytechinus variegatus TaxID=7654 RepID=UPI001BB274EE|nr:voltage-dependent calcium channel subunit alpha-2/delta-3-like isoform X2 [Lytechinus variegatus]